MSLEDTDFNISIKSVDDILRCLSLASLLELAGWPKPGNVHRTKNFEKTRFEHFLAGVVVIQPTFREFCENIYQLSFRNENEFCQIELGYFYKRATEEMMKWQEGGNVLLGHILILAPLAAAATICLKTRKNKINDLKYYIDKVIENSSVNDTVKLYEAIRLSNPGGLGVIEKYDINDENSVDDIFKDNINLKKIFEFSKEYDLISLEYSTGFNIILNEGLPYFVNLFNQYKDINIATVNTYLKLLSLYPDTLVIRKSGLDSAAAISKRASKILEYGGISSKKGLKLALDLDEELQEKRGKLNPGTTADLISGVIFCALLFGLRF
ncbi:MAG: triphosphoribosyl-dephospho-CoA synthase [Candidatus Lokiarchaeota archaeon]|nr:triphosphoribosyl-dephospho-CoA synthase [Candidatus Lokiarchaeota archaeon]